MVITEQMKENLAGIARDYDIALFVLFGSQATGQTHKKSDVDVGFLSHETLDYRKRYELSRALARGLAHPEVELVNLDAVSPVLKKQVADQGVLLYEKQPTVFANFCIYADRTYMETRPLRRYRDEYLNRFLQKYA